jgi:hypothetical protein
VYSEGAEGGWTTVASGLLSDATRSVIWDGNAWLAGGYGTNTIAISEDGLSWIDVPNPFDNGGGVTGTYGLAYNGSQYLAMGQGTSGSIMYSPDNNTWNYGINTASYAPIAYSAAWGQNKWIVCGSAPVNGLVTSTDGMNWNFVSNGPVSTTCTTIAFSGSKWMAGGTGTTRIWYSDDGVLWYASNSSNSVFDTCNSVAWTGSAWVAGGTGATGSVASSPDGVTWSVINLGVGLTGGCTAVGVRPNLSQ